MEASAVPGRRTETWPWWRFPGAGMLLVLAIVVIVVGVLEPRFLTRPSSPPSAL